MPLKAKSGWLMLDAIIMVDQVTADNQGGIGNALYRREGVWTLDELEAVSSEKREGLAHLDKEITDAVE
jgi:hypothetical protein